MRPIARSGNVIVVQVGVPVVAGDLRLAAPLHVDDRLVQVRRHAAGRDRRDRCAPPARRRPPAARTSARRPRRLANRRRESPPAEPTFGTYANRCPCFCRCSISGCKAGRNSRGATITASAGWASAANSSKQARSADDMRRASVASNESIIGQRGAGVYLRALAAARRTGQAYGSVAGECTQVSVLGVN